MENRRIQILCASLLLIVVIVQGVFISANLRKVHTLENSVSSIKGQLSTQDNMNVLSAIALSQPAVSVSDNKVYLPDVHLALPLSNTTTALLYDGRQVGDSQKQDTYDITTRALATLSSSNFQKQFACQPVRFSFETKANPFNPNEKTNPAVKLADGRTLQIYTYANPACDVQWKAADVNPSAIAQLLGQASSY